MRRVFLVLILLAAVGLGGYAGFAFYWGVPSVEARPVPTDAATIEKGRYLAAAGDCASCHTAEGNAPRFAGGRAFDTPFGTLYSANITPADGNGIAGMTTASFYQIMRYGADNILAPLYPAMPYTSFHLVTREDSDAILAYLMSLDPVDKAPPEDELGFPFDFRPLMFGWNFLFASREPFTPDPDRDDAWNRGAYLVRGLGHCGECHTPRNAVGALETDRALSGAVVGTFEAPDIRPQALAARGWNTDHLVTYLQTGASPQGSAFGEMFLVTKNSTRNLTHADLEAIAIYLMDGAVGDPSYGEDEVARLGEAAHANARGQALYLSNCSLCHGRNGGGQAGTMPALAGNSTVSQSDATNLVRVIAHGLGAHATSDDSGYGPMPSFADRLDLGQITALTNYMRAAFATGPAASAPLTETQVKKVLGSSN